MRLALQLAAKARGRTRPNPMVGAVVVARGRIVGQGYHHKAGQPHAEVLALTSAGRRARGATLYVSLEPCAHMGRTPPCVEAITKAGVRRVVAAMIDPNPKNRGSGLQRLKAHGIRTKVGVLEEEARRLNELFITWAKTGRPFISVKVAQTLDGKIATASGDSRWISGALAREWVQHLRAQVDAILVGVNTLLTDDPRLTVRAGGKEGQPLRVVLDSHLRTPLSARLFRSSAPVLIATTRAASRSREKRLAKAGAEILRLPSRGGQVDVRSLVRQLGRREISHLLVEGGGEVIASFFQARAVDRVYCLVCPKIVGGRHAPTAVEGKGIDLIRKAIPLKKLSARPLGDDLLLTADVPFLRS